MFLWSGSAQGPKLKGKAKMNLPPTVDLEKLRLPGPGNHSHQFQPFPTNWLDLNSGIWLVNPISVLNAPIGFALGFNLNGLKLPRTVGKFLSYGLPCPVWFWFYIFIETFQTGNT